MVKQQTTFLPLNSLVNKKAMSDLKVTLFQVNRGHFENIYICRGIVRTVRNIIMAQFYLCENPRLQC